MYMEIGDLTDLELLRGIFSLVYVVISLIFSIKIISKYFAVKRIEFVTVGLSLVCMCSAWWPSAFNIITVSVFNYAIDPPLHILLMSGFIAPGILLWIYSFSILAYPESKNKIYYIYFVICVLYEILFLIFLIIEPNLIAVYEGRFSYKRTLFNLVFQVFAVLSIIVTGFLFAKKSIKSDDSQIRWKGRFLVIAIISYVGASIIDIFSVGNVFLQVILRIILISSAIEYYFGFFLPKWLTKILIKEE